MTCQHDSTAKQSLPVQICQQAAANLQASTARRCICKEPGTRPRKYQQDDGWLTHSQKSMQPACMYLSVQVCSKCLAQPHCGGALALAQGCR